MLLELTQTSTSYAKSGRILDHIDLQIHENEFVGIIGRSGSGKTTLLETIGGLRKPDSGQVLFQGNNISLKGFDQLAFRRNLQIVFQFPENQFFEPTIWDEAAFGPRMLKMSQPEIEKHVSSALHAAGFDEGFCERSPFVLSGGQKRRLALACALAVSPDILLLDEPFSGLDAEGKETIAKLLRDLHEKGMTILMVSHDPDILCSLADRLIVLSDGKVVMDGKPCDIYRDSGKCHEYGIGMPGIKKIADLIRIELAEDYRYANFIKELKSKISGESS